MTKMVVAKISDVAADMMETSTNDGQVLESGPAGLLLQACACSTGMVLHTGFLVLL